MSEKVYIGVAWPYANGSLHLGHIAGCYLPADIFARYNRMKGKDVLMGSGSDEHGTPITITAENEQLQADLNQLISNAEENSAVADNQAIKDIILGLRRSLEEGGPETDFEPDFPYLPKDLEKREII